MPFILLHPLVSPPGFLASAAGVANQTRTAVLIFFVGSALAIAIASAAWCVFREYSSAMALWLFALGVASFVLQAVDSAHILSMLSLSQAYAEAGAAKADVFQALALVVGSARKWSHYSFLLVVGCWIFLLFSLLYRFRLVPRVLAAFGMIGARATDRGRQLARTAGISARNAAGHAAGAGLPAAGGVADGQRVR